MSTAWNFRSKSMSIELDGSVNSRNAIFLLDTGARSFYGNLKLAATYGIDLHDSGELGHSFDGTYKKLIGVADTITIKGLSPAHKISFSAGDKHNGERFLLGQNALISMRALLDFNSSKIYTQNVDEIIDLPLVAKLNKMHSFDLMRGKNLPILEVVVDGKSARFLVDSGTSYSFIDSVFCSKIGLKTNINAKVKVNGRLVNKVAWCDDFSVGKCKLGKMTFVVAPMPNLSCEDGEVISGILGIDFLIATRSLVDAAGSRIYLSDIDVPVSKFSTLPCILNAHYFYEKMNNSKWVGRVLIDHIEIQSDSMKPQIANIVISATVLNKVKGESGNTLKFNLLLDRRRFANKLMIEAFIRERNSRLVFLNKNDAVFTAQEDDLWPEDVMIVE